MWDDIKCIIFDYGGTLDSPGRHWSEIIYDGYKAAGLQIDWSDFYESYVNTERRLGKEPLIKPEYNFSDTMRVKIALQIQYLADRGPARQSDLDRYAIDIAEYCYKSAERSVDSAKPVLAALKGRFTLCLVSNFYGNLQSVIKDYGIDAYFDHVIDSTCVGVRKPNPDIFAMAIKLCGASAQQTVVIGDSMTNDIQPATDLGCKTFWLQPLTRRKNAVKAHIGTYLIDNLNDLIDKQKINLLF